MSFRSLVRKAVLVCCFATLSGCIEYRFDRLDGRDRYLGFVKTIPKLDPKLGSKGKIYSGISGTAQPYIGGRFSRRRLTLSVGVIHYLNEHSSLEVGLRGRVWDTDNDHFGDTTGTISWHDNNDDLFFYFGGKINF